MRKYDHPRAQSSEEKNASILDVHCPSSRELLSPKSAQQNKPAGRLSVKASSNCICFFFFRHELQEERGSVCFTPSSASLDCNSEQSAHMMGAVVEGGDIGQWGRLWLWLGFYDAHRMACSKDKAIPPGPIAF